MSQTCDCYDNAMVERFFPTLKTELLDRQAWPAGRAARGAIFVWIEDVYNRQRLYSVLRYQSPVAFEEALTTVRLVAYYQPVHETGSPPQTEGHHHHWIV